MSNPPDSPDLSPDFLKDTTSHRGGRRLNRLPLMIGAGILLIMLFLIGYVMQTRTQETAKTTANEIDNQEAPAPATPTMQFDGANVSSQDADNVDSGTINSSTQTKAAPAVNAQTTALDTASAQAYEDAATQLAARRQQAYMQALDAPTAASGEGGAMPSTPAMSAPVGTPTGLNHDAMNQGAPLNTDPNKQAQKQAWLKQSPETQDYLNHTRQAPLSPYELKAGSVIPAVMISGINSDLPGQLIAEVRQNVYDTATGQYLILPQGARLVGTYDNGVTMGQSRVLVAWTRVIYPDGSSLDLGLMPGADASGYAGFNDKTNNHYARIFGGALMLSMFSAGVQLSQPQPKGDDNTYSSSQIIAASLGQQLGDLGIEVTRRNLDIAPTLEIRPGYLFNVMITKDIILKPWRGN